MWNEDPDDLRLTYERCTLDVITARAVRKSPKLKPLSETERRYQLQDLTINGRGLLLDRAFATAARDLAIHERIAINLKLQELTDGTITTADQTKRFLDGNQRPRSHPEHAEQARGGPGAREQAR